MATSGERCRVCGLPRDPIRCEARHGKASLALLMIQEAAMGKALVEADIAHAKARADREKRRPSWWARLWGA